MTDLNDALAILSDDHLKAALQRQREAACAKMADCAVLMTLPDYGNWPEEARTANEANIMLWEAAIKSIDARLKGASDLLRQTEVRKKE